MNDKDKKDSILARWLNPEIDRRKFLKTTTALAGTAIVGGALLKSTRAKADTYGANTPDTVESDANTIVRTACQMCHGRCPMQAKVVGGVLVKIDGNPYSGTTMDYSTTAANNEQVPFAQDPSTAIADAGHAYNGVEPYKIRGRMCPRGQAGIQTLYNPFRITTPLRRVGPRGSGKWEPITWATANAEIAAALNALIPWATRNTTEIVSGSSPTLGKIANGLVISPGRSIEGILWERIFKLGYGTANWRLDHTSICEASSHIAGRFVTTGNASAYDTGSSSSYNHKNKHHFFADHAQSKYVVIIGSNPMEASFAMVPVSRGIVDMRASGGKLVVVDPRFSNTAAKADKWVPVKPGADGAFAMALARYLIDNNKHRTSYLRNANKAASNAATTGPTSGAEPTYTDATWLVVTAQSAGSGDVGKLVTRLMSDGTAESAAKERQYCAAVSLVPTFFKPADTVTAVVGDLEPGDVSVPRFAGGTYTCKSVFALFKEEVVKRTYEEWANLCGVPATDIQEIGDELTNSAYGRKTAVWQYRGAAQHSNGTMACFAIQCLATLVGNMDYMGGQTGGAPSSDENNYTGGSPYGCDIKAVTGAASPTGPRLDRTSAAYSTYTSLIARDGYPAKRPWFPFASLGNFQEVIPGIADGYPYPIKALITYWNAFPYSTPALKKVFEETVQDLGKLPLFVAIDPTIGENSAFADYILPDTTYLEKWAVPHSGNAQAVVKNEPIQQPVVGSLSYPADGSSGSYVIGSRAFNPEDQNAFTSYLGSSGPKMVIDIVRDLAVAINASFPGVGASAFAGTLPSGEQDFNRAWNLAKRLFVNFANNAGSTIAAVMQRGGNFDTYANAYASDLTGTVDAAGPYLKNKYGWARRFYVESLATTKRYDADAYYATYGVAKWEAPTFLSGATIQDLAYPYQLITYKLVNHGQARTYVNPWLMMLMPENAVMISAGDARSLGVETGDTVRITSPSDAIGVVGKVKVTEGLRPGVIAVSHHYGHWEGGARAQVVSGSTQFTSSKSEAWRGGGLTVNPIMRADALYPNVSVQDRLGGSVSFLDTRVALEKVTL